MDLSGKVNKKNQCLPETRIKSVISLYSNGQIQEALDAVKTLTKDYPNEPLLYNISGACYKAIGQLDAAVKCYEKAVALKPDYAEAQYNLGITHRELGQLDAAIKSYQDALAIKHAYPNVHNNLGNIFLELSQLKAAVDHFEWAVAYNPEFYIAHNNLGITFHRLGQLDAAVECYEKAIAIQPDYAEAHYNLGNALKELGQWEDAVKSYEKALTLKPDYAKAHNNLGIALKELGQLDAAAESFEKALAINPDYAEALNNLGNAFNQLGQLDAAVKCYEKAIAVNPDYAKAHNNLGIAFKQLGQLDEALASYESAIALDPELDLLLGFSLNTKMHLGIWDDYANQLNELTNKVNNGKKALDPFTMIALIDDPGIQKKTAEIYVDSSYPQNHFLPKIERYPKHKKIRIGYFSADFRDHPVAYLTAELYEMHDRERFEIHAFSFGPDTEDEITLRIKNGVDHFHEVRKMSHKDTAMLARSLEIDIAVDLGGHTQDSRTGIFAMSAAPIQVNYLGYPGTMAAEYIDYLIADHTLIPKESQKYYSEKIVYMPNSFQVNDSKQSLPETVFTRQDFGIPEVGFVFCCFNNTFKITPTTFDSWARILKQVDGSVLLIYIKSESAKTNLTKEIVLRGIQPSRLIFGERLTYKEDHLNRIKQADLFIDTLPYNAHTTTSDALRMGLPVLTCIGNSFASRVAASLLNAINLPELITSTQEQYESVAIELATNPEKLKIIKDKLVDNLATAPLYDTPLFTRHLESAYLTMYDRYQQGLDPEHIYVEH